MSQRLPSQSGKSQKESAEVQTQATQTDNQIVSNETSGFVPPTSASTVDGQPTPLQRLLPAQQQASFQQLQRQQGNRYAHQVAQAIRPSTATPPASLPPTELALLPETMEGESDEAINPREGMQGQLNLPAQGSPDSESSPLVTSRPEGSPDATVMEESPSVAEAGLASASLDAKRQESVPVAPRHPIPPERAAGVEALDKDSLLENGAKPSNSEVAIAQSPAPLSSPVGSGGNPSEIKDEPLAKRSEDKAGQTGIGSGEREVSGERALPTSQLEQGTQAGVMPASSLWTTPSDLATLTALSPNAGPSETSVVPLMEQGATSANPTDSLMELPRIPSDSGRQVSHDGPTFVAPVEQVAKENSLTSAAPIEGGTILYSNEDPSQTYATIEEELHHYYEQQPDQTPEEARAAILEGESSIPLQVEPQVAEQARTQQQGLAQERIAEFLAYTSERLATLQTLQTTIAPRLQAAGQQVQNGIDEAVTTRIADIEISIQSELALVDTQATESRTRVEAAYQSTDETIRNAVEEAHNKIEEGHTSAQDDLILLQSDGYDTVYRHYESAQQQARTKGQEVAAQATTTGNNRRDSYLSQPLETGAPTWLGGNSENYFIARRQARADAAQAVATDYHSTITNETDTFADTTIMAGVPTDIQAVDDGIAGAKQELTTLYQQAMTPIEAQATQERQQAQASRDTKLAAIQAAQDAARNQLTALQTAKVQEVRDLGEAGKAEVAGTTESQIATVSQSAAAALTGTQAFVNQSVAAVSGQENPDLAQIERHLTQAREQLDVNVAQAQSNLEMALTGGEQQLQAMETPFLQSLDEIVAQLAPAMTAITEPIKQEMDTQAQSGVTELEEIATRFKTSAATQADSSVKQMEKIVQTTDDGFKATFAQLSTRLTQDVAGFGTRVQGTLSKMDAEITTKAEEAADQVPPDGLFSTIVNFVGAVIVGIAAAVVVAAIIAGTLTGVGLVLAVVGVLVLGAIVGMGSLALNNWNDATDSTWQEYAGAAAIGTLNAAISLVASFAAGPLGGWIGAQLTSIGGRFITATAAKWIGEVLVDTAFNFVGAGLGNELDNDPNTQFFTNWPTNLAISLGASLVSKPFGDWLGAKVNELFGTPRVDTPPPSSDSGTPPADGSAPPQTANGDLTPSSGNDTPGTTSDTGTPTQPTTTRPDGTTIRTTPSGQRIETSPDGTRTTTYPPTADGNQTVRVEGADGTVQTTYANGSQRTVTPDGTETFITPGGRTTVTTPNGIKTIHYPPSASHPQGWQKIIYPDGRIETVIP